jgi:hypothetical protein
LSAVLVIEALSGAINCDLKKGFPPPVFINRMA